MPNTVVEDHNGVAGYLDSNCLGLGIDTVLSILPQAVERIRV